MAPHFAPFGFTVSGRGRGGRTRHLAAESHHPGGSVRQRATVRDDDVPRGRRVDLDEGMKGAEIGAILGGYDI